jgi:Fe-S cluster biosynthesis and repair protein YggX
MLQPGFAGFPGDANVRCTRCGQDGEGLERPPFGGELGEAIHRSICRGCWAAWLGEQTIQMNERRLSLAKREHAALLTRMMKEFLRLGPA